ncbi:MAG: hypothetical protein JWL73_3816 [Actinomycetia bacterium]|nr:hypothetical protein [Actinomycetes bacterium]
MKDFLEESDERMDRRQVVMWVGIVVAVLAVVGVVNPSALDLVLIIVGILLAVMLHEFGHYLAAKRAGMKVTEFFVGFGPRLWSFRRGETEYGIKAIPLGGYVRIIGMNNLEEVAPEDEPRAFRQGSYKHKMMVVLAGITVNLLLAFVLLGATLVGQGRATAVAPVIGSVSTSSAASAAGLESGDRIVSINGRAIDTFDQIPAAIKGKVGVPLQVTVSRGGRLQTLTVTPRESAQTHGPLIGVTSDANHIIYTHYNPVTAVPETFVMMYDGAKAMGGGFVHLFSPAGIKQYSNDVKTGNANSETRPRSIIGIVYTADQLVGGNIFLLFAILGSLNLFLALFNVVPLLPFDGGHAAVATYEEIMSRIRRRKVVVDFRKLMPVTAVVFVVLMLLAIPAMFLDVLQPFSK